MGNNIIENKDFDIILKRKITKYITSRYSRVSRRLDNEGYNTVEKLKNEYNLIVNKKSMLTSARRNFIIDIFNEIIAEVEAKLVIQKDKTSLEIDKESVLKRL